MSINFLTPPPPYWISLNILLVVLRNGLRFRGFRGYYVSWSFCLPVILSAWYSINCSKINWSFWQLVILTRGHFVNCHFANWSFHNLSFYQLVNLATGHFADWSLCQQDILSIGHLDNWFLLLAFQSIGHFDQEVIL